MYYICKCVVLPVLKIPLFSTKQECPHWKLLSNYDLLMLMHHTRRDNIIVHNLRFSLPLEGNEKDGDILCLNVVKTFKVYSSKLDTLLLLRSRKLLANVELIIMNLGCTLPNAVKACKNYFNWTIIAKLNTYN